MSRRAAGFFSLPKGKLTCSTVCYNLHYDKMSLSKFNIRGCHAADAWASVSCHGHRASLYFLLGHGFTCDTKQMQRRTLFKRCEMLTNIVNIRNTLPSVEFYNPLSQSFVTTLCCWLSMHGVIINTNGCLCLRYDDLHV